MSFLVSNNSGSFALFGIDSRYQGVFFYNTGRMFKAIADIVLSGEKGPVLNELWKVTRDRGVLESFWFAHRSPVFFYEVSQPVEILFDCKLNFDNRVWGRNYEFVRKDNALLVHFEKKNDGRESSEFGEYDFWLALYGCSFDKLEKWQEQHYDYDKKRQSPPFSRWVLNGCRAGGSFVLVFGQSKNEVLQLAKSSWERKDEFAAEAKSFAAELVSNVDVKNEEMLLAAECARYSLACLQEDKGLFAGLPWFHQRWARDELVSAKALLLSGNKSLAKAILFSLLDRLLPDGKLPGTLTHTIADAGWLFLRFEDYLAELDKHERAWLVAKLDFFLNQVEKNLQDGLVVCNARETWMDSIDRGGARIEIQALTLASCRLMRLLKGEHRLEAVLKARVKEVFWKGKYLADGSNDDTVRPNIFIAAYAYFELLSKSEWISCFDYVLRRLWLDWGGLSTLDKNHVCFVPDHTGEIPKSYHCGDSWFWLNNLAALVLFAFDKKKYKNYVQHILKASTKEILYEGAVGHHSELSSASELKPAGCLAQAWSAAMYIELIEELYGHHLTKSQS